MSYDLFQLNRYHASMYQRVEAGEPGLAQSMIGKSSASHEPESPS